MGDLKEYVSQEKLQSLRISQCKLSWGHIYGFRYITTRFYSENMIDLPALLGTGVSMGIKRHFWRFAAQQSTEMHIRKEKLSDNTL